MQKKSNQYCATGKPPKLEFVKIYFHQKGQSEAQSIAFFNYYKNRKWKTHTGCPIKRWTTAANNWIWANKTDKQLTLALKLNIQFPDNISLFYHND